MSEGKVEDVTIPLIVSDKSKVDLSKLKVEGTITAGGKVWRITNANIVECKLMQRGENVQESEK
jgi:uncharacterized protein YqfA (UPF0365 family)